MKRERPTHDVLMGRIELSQAQSRPSLELEEAWNRLLAVDAAVQDMRAALDKIDKALRRE